PNASSLTINAPKQKSNILSNSGQDRESKPENEIDNFFSSLNNTSTQFSASTQAISRNKVTNPFDTVLSTAQKLKSDPSTDTYQQFQNLSLAGLVNLPASSQQSSRNNSQITSNFQNANVIDLFGNSVSSSTTNLNNFSSKNVDGDLFSDFQTAPDLNSNITDSQNIAYRQKTPNQANYSQPSAMSPNSNTFTKNPFATHISSNLSSTRTSTSDLSSILSGSLSKNLTFSMGSLTNNSSDINGHRRYSGAHNLLNSGIQQPDSIPTSSGNLFPFVSPVAATVISQPYGSGHTKKISFDAAFSDLDPLKKQ
ncbi:5967_t:CDS:2, partial [Cetraspora pellucida]